MVSDHLFSGIDEYSHLLKILPRLLKIKYLERIFRNRTRMRFKVLLIMVVRNRKSAELFLVFIIVIKFFIVILLSR